MNEKELVKQLNQNDRIEYKIDTLLKEDIFNFFCWISFFSVMIGLMGGLILKSTPVKLIVSVFLAYFIFSFMAIIIRQILGKKIEEKYFKTIIRRK